MSEYKLCVRVGGHEFKAVGPEHAVREQFDLFLTAVASVPAAATNPAKPAKVATLNGRQPQGSSDPDLPPGYHDQFDEAETNGHGSKIASDLLNRAFRVDGEVVSLRVLPDGDDAHADAMLLLIYAFQAILGANEVGAVVLTEAARRSGINLTRIDRTIARMNGYIRKGGRRRGTRYQINNPGMAKAEEILLKMCG